VCAMTQRVRHCVECPKCRTRYLIGFSPYRNGSYLVPTLEGLLEGWTLYCSCATPPASSRWRGNDLKMYAVSTYAYGCGFGPPKEIVPIEETASHPR